METILEIFIEFVTTLLLFYILVFGHKACGILAPSPGIEPTHTLHPASEGEALTTGPPEKSLKFPGSFHPALESSGWIR